MTRDLPKRVLPWWGSALSANRTSSFHRAVPAVRRIFAVTCAAVLLAAFIPRSGKAGDGVTLYLFSARGCFSCENEKAFLDRIQARYPELTVKEYEVAFHPDNARLMVAVAEHFGVEVGGTPMAFIGDCEPITGYKSDEVTGALIEERVRTCIEEGCEDLAAPVIAAAESDGPYPEAREEVCETPLDTVVALPVVGETDVKGMSLPVLTVVLAGMDGFNPCAFFVLFTLLGILVHARSRRRMLVVGGTFVLFSGLFYFLFMSAWLNVFMHIGEIMLITSAAGFVALFIAAVNIKDFFLFKRGFSLTIPDEAKPRLFERMRGLLKATSLPSMMAGTVVLAAAANSYELLCTVGFPLVFTRVLTLSDLQPLQYYSYLALYNTVYVIPLAAVVTVFSFTLGAGKLGERQGRVMKLVSGMMMLSLGVVLLTDPTLFTDVYLSVGLLAFAVLASVVIVAIQNGWNGRRGRGNSHLLKRLKEGGHS